MEIIKRLSFASRYAIRHALISALLAAAAAGIVFGLWYPVPFGDLLGISNIFFLILVVDAVCGPLLTLILSSPLKSRRERILDFGVIGAIQVIALAYGMHSVWVGRPVVLAFETDRLVVVTANEVEMAELSKAPEGMRQLPIFGVMRAGIKRAANSDEMLESLGKDMGGLSPAMRPGWWTPWDQQLADLKTRTKPLTELIARRPQDVQTLRNAAKSAGADPANLSYLPLTSSKVKEWVALLDADLKLVGYAPVDGF